MPVTAHFPPDPLPTPEDTLDALEGPGPTRAELASALIVLCSSIREYSVEGPSLLGSGAMPMTARVNLQLDIEVLSKAYAVASRARKARSEWAPGWNVDPKLFPWVGGVGR